ncbi:hypothetical protein B0I35DRAFT_364160, partial [Stachybotrys elegans]
PTAATPTNSAISSVCRGTICPAMLATTPGKSESETLFFALGQDNEILVRTWDDNSWQDQWTSLGGPFVSQPAAVKVNDQINVLAVNVSSRDLMNRVARNGIWESTWSNLGGYCTSPPTACSRESGLFDVFVKDGGNALSGMVWTDPGGWSDWIYHGSMILSSPVVSCAGENRLDVLFYGTDPPFGLCVERWNSEKGWLDWDCIKGSYFIGDPCVLSIGSDRTDVFAIGSYGKMYHTTWTASTGWADVGNLEGSFESVPYAFATGSSRIDVLAVGTDDRLKHKAMINSTWDTGWDDLGGSFNSAPVAVVTNTGRVGVYGIALNGSIFHATWTIGEGFGWSDGTNWEFDGGAMATRAQSGWY